MYQLDTRLWFPGDRLDDESALLEMLFIHRIDVLDGWRPSSPLGRKSIALENKPGPHSGAAISWVPQLWGPQMNVLRHAPAEDGKEYNARIARVSLRIASDLGGIEPESVAKIVVYLDSKSVVLDRRTVMDRPDVKQRLARRA